MYGRSRRDSRTRPARRNALFALATLLCPVGALHAGEVYKSVDAEGHVVYSDHADASTPQTVVQMEAAPYPPPVLHFCWTNCFTLNYDNGVYTRADGTDETWSVERFTDTSVILHRHSAPAAWNGNSSDVTYQGQSFHERLTNVTVNGRPVPDVNMAWGDALDMLPGSNADRDQRKSAQAGSGSDGAASAPPPADFASVDAAEIRAAEAPPALLTDEQPPCPDEGYLWNPGYWSFADQRYYWVPGTWVLPPRIGVLWTPGYWAFSGAVFVFHPGYWGPHIGYYGGISYGFGYYGTGFAGGRWVGNSFAYNRSVNNLNETVIHNTYNETVVHNAATKVSYNGGPGGTTAVPSAQERSAALEPHIPPTPFQRQYMQHPASSPLVAQTGVHSAWHNTGISNPPKPATPSNAFTPPKSAGAHGASASPAHGTASPVHATLVRTAATGESSSSHEPNSTPLTRFRSDQGAPRAAPTRTAATTSQKPQPHPKP